MQLQEVFWIIEWPKTVRTVFEFLGQTISKLTFFRSHFNPIPKFDVTLSGHFTWKHLGNVFVIITPAFLGVEMFLDGEKCHTQKVCLYRKFEGSKVIKYHWLQPNLSHIFLLLFLLTHFKTCLPVPYNSEHTKFSLFCSVPFVCREIQASRVTLRFFIYMYR